MILLLERSVPLCSQNNCRSGNTIAGLLAEQLRVKSSKGSESEQDVSRPRKLSGKAEKLPIEGSEMEKIKRLN